MKCLALLIALCFLVSTSVSAEERKFGSKTRKKITTVFQKTLGRFRKFGSKTRNKIKTIFQKTLGRFGYFGRKGGTCEKWGDMEKECDMFAGLASMHPKGYDIDFDCGEDGDGILKVRPRKIDSRARWIYSFSTQKGGYRKPPKHNKYTKLVKGCTLKPVKIGETVREVSIDDNILLISIDDRKKEKKEERRRQLLYFNNRFHSSGASAAMRRQPIGTGPSAGSGVS